MIMREQDSQLEEVGATIGVLKHMGTVIGDELEDQNQCVASSLAGQLTRCAGARVFGRVGTRQNGTSQRAALLTRRSAGSVVSLRFLVGCWMSSMIWL